MMHTPPTKMVAIALVAWAALGSAAVGVSVSFVVVILLVLLALLDAAERRGELELRSREANRRDKTSAFPSPAAWPWGFYALLIGLACWILNERQPSFAPAASTSLAASRGWPMVDPAVTDHATGAAGRCACGKPLGHDKTAATSPAEAAKRIEALKKRTMNPAPKGIPTANFPGIGPNAKPLAPGLVPNAAAKLPPSAQKLLEASGQPSVPQANPPPSPSAIGPAEPRANLTPAPAPASSAPLSPTPQPSSSVPSKLPQPAGSPL